MAAIETWEKVTDSVVWIPEMTPRGEVRSRRLQGPAGRRFQIKATDREAGMIPGALTAYNNGQLKPIKGVPDDVAAEVATPDLMTNDELIALFEKHGAAFHAAIDKLNEMNVRRLKALAEEQDEGEEPVHQVTVAQLNKINDTVATKFRHDGPTSGYADIAAAGAVTSVA